MNNRFYKLDEKNLKLINHRLYANRDKDKTGFDYSENKLEKLIISAPESIYPHKFIIIGEQVKTDFGPLDLLGIDDAGDLLLIEVKTGVTPRDVVAQVLEYAAFLDKKSIEDILLLSNMVNSEEVQEFIKKCNIENEKPSIKIIIVSGWIDKSIFEVSRFLTKNKLLWMSFVEIAYYINEGSGKFLEFSTDKKINPKPNLEDVLRRLVADYKKKSMRNIFRTIESRKDKYKLQFKFYVVPKGHNRIDICANNKGIGHMGSAYKDRFGLDFKLPAKRSKAVDNLINIYGIKEAGNPNVEKLMIYPGKGHKVLAINFSFYKKNKIQRQLLENELDIILKEAIKLVR